MSNKPVWKRNMDGSLFGDFLDGRGIVLYRPDLIGRNDRVCEDGWMLSGGEGKAWPEYLNEQPTKEGEHQGGLRVVHYAGMQFNFLLSAKQTEKWNEHHGFTPYAPDPHEEERKRIRTLIFQQERAYQRALEMMKSAISTIEAHPSTMISLHSELNALNEQEDSQ